MATLRDIAKRSRIFDHNRFMCVEQLRQTLFVPEENVIGIYQEEHIFGIPQKSLSATRQNLNVALLYWVSDMEELQDVEIKTMRTESIRQADKQNVSVTVFKRFRRYRDDSARHQRFHCSGVRSAIRKSL